MPPLKDDILSARMIRAARGLLNIDQTQLAELVDVSRRTIIRIEAEDSATDNDRRTSVLRRIRDVLETKYEVRFVFPNASTGEGVVMKKGK